MFHIDFEVPQNAERAVLLTAKTRKELKIFDKQPVSIEYEAHGYEIVKPVGKEYKAVRVYPTESGEVVFEKGGETLGRVGFSAKEGYLPREIAEVPVGMNLCATRPIKLSNGKEFGISSTEAFLGVKEYERWIKKAARNGVELIRIWASSPYLNPDKGDGVDPVAFEKLDGIFDLCAKYGIKIKLTLEHFRYAPGGEWNAYFVKDVGCTIENWLKSPERRAKWLQKVEAYSARYAASPELWAIELWNEQDCMDAPLEVIADWQRAVTPAVREAFPEKTVLNSMGSLDCDYQKERYLRFPFDLFDYVQIHSYLDQGSAYPEVMQNPIEAYKKSIGIMKGRIAELKKPFYIAETGGVNDNHSGPFRYYACDDDGLIFVDCVYSPLFMGAAMPSHIWHWDEYVEKKNLYKYYLPIKELIKNKKYPLGEYVANDYSTEQAYCLTLSAKGQTLGFVRNKSASWQNVLRDGNDPGKVEAFFLTCGVKFSEVKVIPIWNDDVPEEKIKDGKICFSAFEKGFLFVANE